MPQITTANMLMRLSRTGLARLDILPAPGGLHLVIDSGLLEDGVGEHAGSDGHGHGKGSAVDGAVSDFVTALALAPQLAAVVEQNFPQGAENPLPTGQPTSRSRAGNPVA